MASKKKQLAQKELESHSNKKKFAKSKKKEKKKEVFPAVSEAERYFLCVLSE